jgi:hypothetical protein
MAPADTLIPPSEDRRSALQKLLESNEYRTAVVASPGRYGAHVEPHLAEFWGIRLTGGYGAGVPCQLNALPWPRQVRQVRSLSFAEERDIHWGLLSLLNTKYVVLVDDPLFFNTARDVQPRMYTNPLPVLPRHFFAKSVRPRAAPETTAVEAENPATFLPAPKLWVTAHSMTTAVLFWQFPERSDVKFAFERAVGPEGQFLAVRDLPSGARALVVTDQDPGVLYRYRLRARQGRRLFSEYSETVTAVSPTGDVATPAEVGVEWTAPGEVLLSWRAMPGTSYAVEVADAEAMRFEPYARTEAGVGQIRIAGLGNGAHGFRLRAEQQAGWSPHSKEAWVMSRGATDDAVSRRLHEQFPTDLRERSFVDGDLETDSLDASGTINACYQADRISLEVTPSPQARFVVLDELYHPRWHAFADGQEVAIYPANLFMRGILLPPNTGRLELRFIPFLHTTAGRLLLAAGLGQALAIGWILRRFTVASPQSWY